MMTMEMGKSMKTIPLTLFFPHFANKFRGEGHLIAILGKPKSHYLSQKTKITLFGGISGVAAGDIDGDSSPDIFATTKHGVMRLDPQGNMSVA